MPPDRISGFGLIQHATAGQFHVSGLQSAGSLLLCQEYRRTARKCQ